MVKNKTSAQQTWEMFISVKKNVFLGFNHLYLKLIHSILLISFGRKIKIVIFFLQLLSISNDVWILMTFQFKKNIFNITNYANEWSDFFGIEFKSLSIICCVGTKKYLWYYQKLFSSRSRSRSKNTKIWSF